MRRGKHQRMRRTEPGPLQNHPRRHPAAGRHGRTRGRGGVCRVGRVEGRAAAGRGPDRQRRAGRGVARRSTRRRRPARPRGRGGVRRALSRRRRLRHCLPRRRASLPHRRRRRPPAHLSRHRSCGQAHLLSGVFRNAPPARLLRFGGGRGSGRQDPSRCVRRRVALPAAAGMRGGEPALPQPARRRLRHRGPRPEMRHARRRHGGGVPSGKRGR